MSKVERLRVLFQELFMRFLEKPQEKQLKKGIFWMFLMLFYKKVEFPRLVFYSWPHWEILWSQKNQGFFGGFQQHCLIWNLFVTISLPFVTILENAAKPENIAHYLLAVMLMWPSRKKLGTKKFQKRVTKKVPRTKFRKNLLVTTRIMWIQNHCIMLRTHFSKTFLGN